MCQLKSGVSKKTCTNYKEKEALHIWLKNMIVFISWDGDRRGWRRGSQRITYKA
jgi:hypothetical protein